METMRAMSTTSDIQRRWGECLNYRHITLLWNNLRQDLKNQTKSNNETTA